MKPSAKSQATKNILDTEAEAKFWKNFGPLRPGRTLGFNYKVVVSGGSMEPLDFWERCNGTARLWKFDSMDPVIFNAA